MTTLFNNIGSIKINSNDIPKIDEKVKKFFDQYYHKIQDDGFSETESFFDINSTIIFQRTKFNFFQYITNLIKNDVSKARYRIERYDWVVLDKDKGLLVVNGSLNYVSIKNFIGVNKTFTDTMIIDFSKEKIQNLITNLN